MSLAETILYPYLLEGCAFRWLKEQRFQKQNVCTLAGKGEALSHEPLQSLGYMKIYTSHKDLLQLFLHLGVLFWLTQATQLHLQWNKMQTLCLEMVLIQLGCTSFLMTMTVSIEKGKQLVDASFISFSGNYVLRNVPIVCHAQPHSNIYRKIVYTHTVRVRF